MTTKYKYTKGIASVVQALLKTEFMRNALRFNYNIQRVNL